MDNTNYEMMQYENILTTILYLVHTHGISGYDISHEKKSVIHFQRRRNFFYQFFQKR